MNIHEEINRIFASSERGTLADAFKAQEHLHAILSAYEKCGGDELTLPTPLLAAIIAARLET